MIPRTLVPVKVRPVTADEAKKVGTRTTTYMDDRTVVPTGPSDAPPLTGKSNIPAHLPLGVLVNRTLVERGMAVKPFEHLTPASDMIPLAILDSRVVVPAYVEPATLEEQKDFEHTPELTANLREVIEPDMFITGDANLLIEPEKKREVSWIAVIVALTALFYAGLVTVFLIISFLIPRHTVTPEEGEIARRELTYLLPPETPAPRTPPAPKLRITPKTLNRVAPPVEPTPAPTPAPPAPTPAKPAPELPEAPRPRVPVAPPPQPVQTQPAPSQLESIKPAQPNSRLNLQLPSANIHDQLQDAIKDKNSGGGIQAPIGSSTPSGPGGPGMGYGAQILTPTEGVDFNPYIQRLLETLRRNWYAIMPESALLGDKGGVYTTFQINRDGSVPSPDPQLERTSGKGPLDNAAMSSIRASNPFEPLPSEFKGPYIRLRIVFLYNLPLESAR